MNILVPLVMTCVLCALSLLVWTTDSSQAACGQFFETHPWTLCISVEGKQGTDRRQVVTREFQTRGIQPPRYNIGVRNSKNPGKGCYDAHVKCMRDALKANVPYAIVFEDDVGFAADDTLQGWTDVTKFLETEKFDVLQLGWCVGGHRPGVCENNQRPVPGYPSLARGKCFCLHAVVYSKKFMRRFVREAGTYDKSKEQPEIDDVIVDMPDVDIVLVKRPLFIQRDVPSIIDPSCGPYRHMCD